MKTKRQEEIVRAYLSAFDQETQTLYFGLAQYLSELGYNPRKERSHIVFKHDCHNKQMVKMGVKRGKEPRPYFGLRFSACRGYSQRFADIVAAEIEKHPNDAARCPYGACDFCAGEPATHVYTHTFPDGETKTFCGAHALEIPNLTADDVPEIRRLIAEEHRYLMKHEAGIEVA
ncbi:MAG TPA: hypothetical protein H9674_09415 [Firmicutes bacterium]|nr:hypothetical protein [Bacillota bacterium]